MNNEQIEINSMTPKIIGIGILIFLILFILLLNWFNALIPLFKAFGLMIFGFTIPKIKIKKSNIVLYIGIIIMIVISIFTKNILISNYSHFSLVNWLFPEHYIYNLSLTLLLISLIILAIVVNYTNKKEQKNKYSMEGA